MPVRRPALLFTPRPRQAADALGIGRSKLYELLASGELESIHIGTARRIPTQALEHFVERRRAAAQVLGRLA
jgi:excisionase family DNA binding protein